MRKRDDKIKSIPGVGVKAEKDFSSLEVKTYYDMASLMPRAYEDRREERKLRDASVENPIIYTQVTIKEKGHFPAKNGKQTLKITAIDDNGDTLELYCFNRDYLERMLITGHAYYITANVSKRGYRYFAASFEIKKSKEELMLGRILPIYPLSGALTQALVRRAVDYALSEISPMEDELPHYLYQRNGLMHHSAAYYLIHHPNDPSDVERAKTTLAFTELFYLSLKNARSKSYERVNKKSVAGENEKKLIASLPFNLTNDQIAVLEDIRNDLDRKDPMDRLLEGDVGSGKTLVAWISALHEIAKGKQVAFMAPTELLAKQHAENAASLLSPLGIRLCYLTGSISPKSRALLLTALKNGEVDLAIGTHALFTEDVEFKNLGYVIIDEEHRFGVEQRKALRDKAKDPNLLSMTATPIPRSLALTMYSGYDLSLIKAKPEGRLSVKTYTVSSEKTRSDMLERIRVEFERGHQAFFVYPRIEEDEDGSVKAVERMIEELRDVYPEYKSAMVHSRLKDDEKVEILNRFRAGEYQYIVATSVIEVGIDIPNATCIVIEHADRFGLAQLHQLRGRVGRSSLQSYCFLVFDKNISEDGKERMRVMKETNDGFLIAEKDLEIRGPGALSGLKQSGFLRLRFASLVNDTDLLEKAKEEAELIAKEDRGLIKSEHAVLRKYITEYMRDEE